MIKQSDSLEFLKESEDYEFDIMYADPPYALGSEIVIREDGKVDYKKAVDFMNKWDMPTGKYWEKWFKEAFRTLKYGGRLIMFGMDRQLLLFKYYAKLAGFVEQQSLYWYFISSFPKATDLSKMIDKNAGVEREVVGKKNGTMPNIRGDGSKMMVSSSGLITEREQNIITKSTTKLGEKYEGYKYSISPLKQTCETIMVFQKPYKTKSCLHDTLAYENGDEECCCGALNIDGNRVGFETISVHNAPKGTFAGGELDRGSDTGSYRNHEGRYPAQAFIDSEVAEKLDLQIGVSGGGCSKILNKCDYEQIDFDLFVYQPKVSKKERNAGLDTLEDLKFNSDVPIPQRAERPFNSIKNNHPTLKPIALNEKVLRLFKTPNNQKICYPFAGAGSEIIGGIKAGFDNWAGCEINEDYVEIAKARIEHWTNHRADYKTTLDTKTIIKESIQEDKEIGIQNIFDFMEE